MRVMAIVLLVGLTAPPVHAHENVQRTKIVGAVLTAVGAAATLVGLGVLIDGERQPTEFINQGGSIQAICLSMGSMGCGTPQSGSGEIAGGAAAMGIGGALTAAGATLLAVSLSRERRLTVAPSLARSGGGVRLMLRF